MIKNFRKLELRDDKIVLSMRPVGKKRIELRSLKSVTIAPVLSLVDELGITLHADEDIFFTDADSWFSNVAESLRFDVLFGDDWYAKAESGETLRADL